MYWWHAMGTEWQRPIGCFKLQVIFRKRATNYRALLRKMTYKDKASYGSLPPCIHIVEYAYIIFVYYMYVCTHAYNIKTLHFRITNHGRETGLRIQVLGFRYVQNVRVSTISIHIYIYIYIFIYYTYIYIYLYIIHIYIYIYIYKMCVYPR